MSFLSTDQSNMYSQIANCIIPPAEKIPGAGDINILDSNKCEVEITTKQKTSIIEFLKKTTKTSMDLFDSQFNGLTETNKIQILKKIEGDNPNLFNLMIQIIYSEYYSNPEVLRAKNQPFKAFQPDGFTLEPFNVTSVTKVLNRGKKYRD